MKFYIQSKSLNLLNLLTDGKNILKMYIFFDQLIPLLRIYAKKI